MADTEAYCVKCKSKREMKGAREETTEKGRRMMRGKCPTCDTNMTKFLPSKK